MPSYLNGVSRFLFGMYAIRGSIFMGCNRNATSSFVHVAILYTHPSMSKRHDASLDRHAPRWNRFPAKVKGKDVFLDLHVAKWKLHPVKSKGKGASFNPWELRSTHQYIPRRPMAWKRHKPMGQGCRRFTGPPTQKPDEPKNFRRDQHTAPGEQCHPP
jgi:hypothetical protein